MKNFLSNICKLQEKINNKSLLNKYVSNHLLKKLEKMKEMAIRKEEIKFKDKEIKIIDLSVKISRIEDDKILKRLMLKYSKNSNFFYFNQIIKRRNYLAKQFGFVNYYSLFENKIHLEDINDSLLLEINNLVKDFIVNRAQQYYKQNINNEEDFIIDVNTILKNFNGEIFKAYLDVDKIEYRNNDNCGALTYYMPLSDHFKINIFSMNNEDIIEYLIHELGHIYEVCNMEKEERQKYKIFLYKETCECVPCMLEGGFLKFIYHYDEKIFTSLYMWKKDIVTLIPYLLIKFLFEQYVYINENKITEIDLNRYWENLLLKYMPHQVGNKDFHWLKKFVIDDLPFNSFKYLLGRIVSLLTLGSEEDLKDIYTKYFKFGFKFSNYFEFNRKNINNIDKYVNIC